MKEKTRARLVIAGGVLVALAVIATMGLYLMGASMSGGLGFFELLQFPIVLLLAGGALYMVWEVRKSYKAGLPTKDERSKQIGYRSGYYAFIVAMYSGLAMSIFGDNLLGSEFAPRHVAEAVVLCSGLVFILSYLYLSRKGNV